MFTRISAAVFAFYLAAAWPISSPAQPEQASPERLSLENLDAFRPAGDNWSIVGGVVSDRTVDHDIDTSPGTGVLANLPSGNGATNLTSRWEHGDIQLSMDVLVPRGSNSGIYLQGRYEVQILDSWGVVRPTYGDMGGIYERWDPARPEGEKGFQGKPPRINATRAPGLWQHLTIDFRAPRFDEDGNKIRNAVFEKVTLNGVTIHRNISVTGPTRGSAFEDEAERGPVIVQGDHGPVAFRNIAYIRYGNGRSVRVDSVSEQTAPNPIMEDPAREPRIIRSYINHAGEKRTHVVSVGDPAGVHYSYDLARGSLLKVWKGPFAETTRMWHSRGIEQVLEPRGSVIAQPGQPDLAFLGDRETVWPDSLAPGTSFRYIGYTLDEAGRPTFSYRIDGLHVNDHLEPSDHGLQRMLRIEGRPNTPVWLRLAVGSEIRPMPDGVYRVDGPSHYLRIDKAAGEEPVVRRTSAGKELLLRISAVEAQVSYSLIW